MSLVLTRLSESLSPEHTSQDSLAHYCGFCLVHFPQGLQKRAPQLGSHPEPCRGGEYSSGLSSKQRVAPIAPPLYPGPWQPSWYLGMGLRLQGAQFLTLKFLKPNCGQFPNRQLYLSLLWVTQRPALRCGNLCFLSALVDGLPLWLFSPLSAQHVCTFRDRPWSR